MMRAKTVLALVAAFLPAAWGCLSAAAAQAGAAAESAAPGVAALGARSSWRCHFTWGTQPVRRESGELAHANMSMLFEGVKDAATGKITKHQVRTCPPLHTPLPPADWKAVEFDDSSWQRRAVPLCSGDPLSQVGQYRNIPLIGLRGKFMADDPAKVGDLRLAVRYRGGVVVSFNGQEIGRANIPKGDVDPLTPAEDYPPEAFLDADGKPIKHGGDRYKQYEKHRVREMAVTIPVLQVRKGVNVLALEVHGAPLPEAVLNKHVKSDGSAPRMEDMEKYYYWSLGGVDDIRLTSAGGAGFQNGSVRPQGIQVWNHPVTEWVSASDFGDPGEKLAPVRIISPRNGAFAGQVVIGSTEPIKGLKATASELSGPGGAVIPASAVEVRWGVPDGYRGGGSGGTPYFDGLAEAPPAETPVFKESGASVQPVWITVHTPADAKPGEYRGKVILAMNGSTTVDVPLNVRVIDWKMPDPPFTTIVDVVQSPESLAMWHDVPLWSRKHWQLMDKSFKVLGEAGCNAITLTLIRRTHFGNEHGMVFWTRQPDGSLAPDLSVAERYINTAVKHLGKIPIVILYVWELGGTTRHSGGMGIINMDREILISVRNRDTGLMEEARGPEWGTQECTDFWRPAIDGIRDILARHGIGDSLMIGVAGDRRPSATAVKTLAAAAPYAPWYMHSHTSGGGRGFYGQPIAYWSSVWPSSIDNPDSPDQKRIYNFQRWKQSPYINTCFPRQRLNAASSPTLYRLFTERFVIEVGQYYGGQMTAGQRGFGRLGADFWGVLDSHPASFGYDATRVGDKVRYNISSRYPEAEWQNLGLNYTIPALLSPGPDGAFSTARLEAIREGAEENEARFFLEKALADVESRVKLGEALAARCQEILDERARTCITSLSGMGMGQILDSGIQDRSERIFLLAAEAARKLDGGK